VAFLALRIRIEVALIVIIKSFCSAECPMMISRCSWSE